MEIPSRLIRVVALLGFPCIVILVILALLNSTTNPLNPKVEQNNNKLSECVPIFNEGLELVEKEFNSTTRYLKRPEEYAEVAEKCAEAIVCALLTSKASNDTEVIRKYNACRFLVFYYSTFENCARTLYNSTEIPCLETIFHHDIEDGTYKCAEWDEAFPCLLRQIQSTCDVVSGENKTEIQEKKEYYTGEFANLRPMFCSNSTA